MTAVGYKRALPIDDPESLLDVTLPEPVPEPHDLLVDIKAICVNPVDTTCFNKSARWRNQSARLGCKISQS